MSWLAVTLVCLVMASFALLAYARARRAREQADAAVPDPVDPDVRALRDHVMARMERRGVAAGEPVASDAFHVESDGVRMQASVSRLYFAVADAPALREELVGEYVEGLLMTLRARASGGGA